MEQRSSANRRRHVRYPLATTVQFHHGPSGRDYPARSVDTSAGGLLMYVPVGTPVAPGQAIRLQLGSHSRPELAGVGAGPIEATVVRVDRQKVLSLGYLPVGVRFT